MRTTRVTTTAAILLAVGALLAAGVVAVVPGAAAAEAPSACPEKSESEFGEPTDFDGDLAADAAFALPSRRVDAVAEAGAVQLQQSCGPDVVLTARSLGAASLTPGGRFGTTVWAGRLDRDQTDDLVVSAPGQDGTGVVGIVYGSPTGLGNGRPSLRITVPGLHHGDRFGAAVAVSTAGPRHVFIGAPGVDVGRSTDAGAVFDVTLALDGTSVASVSRWTQGGRGFPGQAERNDRFGEVLSTGQPASPAYTGAGKRFVVVGVPHEDVGKAVDAGAVYVVHGAEFDRAAVVTQATRRVPGTAQRGDQFGAAVLGTSGKPYGGERRKGVGGSAVYVGVPGEDVGRAKDAGVVQRLAVSDAFKLTASTAQGQNSPGVPGAAESGDRLGSSLTLLNYYAKGEPEVATGAPYEDVGRAKDAGSVTTLAFRVARCKGCTTATQVAKGVNRATGRSHRYGWSLTPTFSASDGDTYFGYLVGAPGDDAGSRTDAGLLGTRHGTLAYDLLGEVRSSVSGG